jgi:DNA-binding GntR family transcriptional regulator
MRAIAGGIRGNTLAQQIRAALTERILSGELPPGARLKDNEVAAQFGTSNTPVREALRELAKEGLVQVVPYRGCEVRRMDLHELAEVFDVRVALEALVVRLVAGSLSGAQLVRLEALVDEHEAAAAADERKRSADADIAFHRLLAEAAGNHVLASILQQLGYRAHLARRMYLRDRPVPPQLTCRPILEALHQGDADRAAALMADHLICTKEELLLGLTEQASGGTPES